MVSAWPFRLRCRLRSVVAPKLLLLLADADVLAVEQMDDGGEHGVPIELAAAKVLFDPAPQPRELLAEFEQAFVLGRFPLLAESGVIAILLAPARIDAGRLQVSVR